ncbi:hypothetical protein FEE96_06675 [Parasedimentitalea maritima]|uniref:Uncharacterized protein n=1 Tax=Parasedimentitalea maritima TaxID=2578117 RepID=A0ABY2UWN9_9RHOB|nr:hypothetical protein [Zongyanglinia marina]TLP67030.1 hypothetical protein FEE96_06675 [Zongyanglinia marina]
MKKLLFIAAAYVSSLGAASAEFSWHNSTATSCLSVCNASKQAPVSTGTYDGENYYICSFKTDSDTSPRPGYNLIQGWSPKGESCFSAAGKNSAASETFSCLCNKESPKYPLGTFDVATVPAPGGLQKDLLNLSDGSFAVRWADKLSIYSNKGVRTGAILQIPGEIVKLPDGGFLAFYDEVTGHVDRSVIRSSYIQKYDNSGQSVGERLTVKIGDNEANTVSASVVKILKLSPQTGHRYVLAMYGGFVIYDANTHTIDDFQPVLPIPKYGSPDNVISDVALLSNGSFEVLSYSDNMGEDWKYISRFNSKGTNVSAAKKLYTKETNHFANGRIFATPDGGFEAFWPTYVNGDGNTHWLARSFDASGSSIGDSVSVSNLTAPQSAYLNLASVGENCKLATFAEVLSDGNFDIKMSLVNSKFKASTPISIINSDNGNPMNAIGLRLDDGSVLMSWEAYQTNDTKIVRGQIFPSSMFACQG